MNPKRDWIADVLDWAATTLQRAVAAFAISAAIVFGVLTALATVFHPHKPAVPAYHDGLVSAVATIDEER